MADKTASVKLNADPKGFISGLKQVENAAKQTGAKIETSLSKAANKAAADFMKSAREIAKVGLRGPDGKFLDSGLSKLKDMAKTVKDAYRDAYREAVKLEALKASRSKEFAKEQAANRKESIGTLKTIGGAALGGAVALSGKAIVDANRVLDKATRISIGARGAGEVGVDPTVLTKEFFAITQDVKGVTADALADATAKYVGMTGDLKTARSSLKDFAIAAQASGASVEDVAGTAAAISQQFGITDPGQIREVLGALIGQGKAGAFELKDAAALFPGLAAAGASFGLDKGVGGVKTLGGIVQIARTGTGSGEMAATNVNAMLTALKTNADKLQLAGTKVYEGTGANKKTRDLPTIIAEMIAKTGGTDLAKKNAGLTEILTATGFKAIAPLVTQYQDMFKQSSGTTDAARQADAQEQLRQKILDSVNAAGSWADTVQDAATAGSTSSAKMTSAWEGFTGQVSEKVLPKLGALGDKALKAGGSFDMLVSALSGFVDTANFVADQFMWIGRQIGGGSKDEQLMSQYKMEIAGRDRAREQLTSMQMRPEEIAKLQKEDPEKLSRLRDRAKQLQDTANQYDMRAQDTWAKYAETDQGKEAVAKARASADAEKAAGAPVKAELSTDKEIRVRVTNPKEVGAQPPGAPAPGYLPRP